jgi:hypothetical protein
MQYREIVAVTGLGGLFQLVATKSDGAIVRSLADNTTKFIPSRLHNVTPLDSIEIYTTASNVRLHEVLQKMKEHASARPDAKKADTNAIRNYFKEVYPTMDEERVYSSDMKKMLKWYEILDGAGLLDFSAMAEEDVATDETGSMPAEGDAQMSEHSKGEEVKEMALIEEGDEKPAKKARAKKAATSEESGDEKPAKKTAAKKKAEDAEEGAEAPKKAAKAKKKDTE